MSLKGRYRKYDELRKYPVMANIPEQVPSVSGSGYRISTFWYRTHYGILGEAVYKKMKTAVYKAEKEEVSSGTNTKPETGTTTGEYSFTSGKLLWLVGQEPGDTQTNRITSLYGYRPNRGGGKHSGIDIGRSLTGASVDKIYATADGVAVDVKYSSTAGNVIVLKHEESGGTWYSIYMHGANNSFQIKKGDKVKAGQYIMQMGNTGDSKLKHLHFEILKAPVAHIYDHSRSLDPTQFFKHIKYKVAPTA